MAAGVSVLLAQSATWTTPRNWATDDLLTAADFNAQFRDNLLWLRQDAQLTGTDALDGSRLRHARDERSAVLGLHLGDDPGSDACGQLDHAGRKMADNAVGPAEMDPESATEGQVMLIGSGGDPTWRSLLNFRRHMAEHAGHAGIVRRLINDDHFVTWFDN